MGAIYADIYGGVTTLGSQATLLSSETSSMCQITIRTLPTASRVYFGNVNVTAAGDNAQGYIEGGEWHTWGPFSRDDFDVNLTATEVLHYCEFDMVEHAVGPV